MQYVKDASYFLGDTTSAIESMKKREEYNVKFLQSMSLASSRKFRRYRTLCVHALHNTALEDQLLVHYRYRHKFYDQERL